MGSIDFPNTLHKHISSAAAAEAAIAAATADRKCVKATRPARNAVLDAEVWGVWGGTLTIAENSGDRYSTSMKTNDIAEAI